MHYNLLYCLLLVNYNLPICKYKFSYKYSTLIFLPSYPFVFFKESGISNLFKIMNFYILKNINIHILFKEQYQTLICRIRQRTLPSLTTPHMLLPGPIPHHVPLSEITIYVSMPFLCFTTYIVQITKLCIVCF